jgi:uncharacterized membrane protein
MRAGARVPGIVLGIGLGGFVDGIVLHQVLQWHHMRSGEGIGGERSTGSVSGLEANTLGVYLLSAQLRRDGAPSRRALTGLLLAGWGVFNVVEGLIDHQLLGIHHVRDDIGAPLGWDLAFLAFGALLIVIGWIIAGETPIGRGQSPRRSTTARGETGADARLR